MTNESLTDRQRQMARFAKALGHPVRIYILELLSIQSCCYSGDLSEQLPNAKSTLSQHLKELKNAGLIQGKLKLSKLVDCINKDSWEHPRIMLKNLLVCFFLTLFINYRIN